MWRFSQVKAKNAEILDVFRVFLTLNCGNKHYLEAIYHYGALPNAGGFLNELLFVDDQLELQSQLFGGLSAQDHAFQKDFKIIHHRTKFGVDHQL